MAGRVAGLWIAMICGLAGAVEPHEVLVLGRVSTDPQAQYEPLKALLDYVVERMGDVGIREGRILMAGDAQQMASYLRRGRVDWVSETAGGAMLLQRRADAQALLLSERNGISRYHTIYFARADSGLASIDDLRGRRIAFQFRTSTSAYLIPAIELLDRGMTLEILTSPTDHPSASSVGYVFARSELNIATWVHKRLVDVGVLSNLDWADSQRVPDEFRSDFVILRQSPDFPRGVEMVREDLAPAVRDRLREVLLGVAVDPGAQATLGRFDRSLRFVALDARTRLELDVLRAGVERVVTEIE